MPKSSHKTSKSERYGVGICMDGSLVPLKHWQVPGFLGISNFKLGYKSVWVMARLDVFDFRLVVTEECEYSQRTNNNLNTYAKTILAKDFYGKVVIMDERKDITKEDIEKLKVVSHQKDCIAELYDIKEPYLYNGKRKRSENEMDRLWNEYNEKKIQVMIKFGFSEKFSRQLFYKVN